MGLTVTSDDKGVKVYVKEREWSGGSFKVYSLGISSKDKDGNWINGYLDAEFKKADADKITNKCKIKINNSWYKTTESNGKKYNKIFVNDFEVLEDGEGDEVVSLDEFMKIPENVGEELPFK